MALCVCFVLRCVLPCCVLRRGVWCCVALFLLFLDVVAVVCLCCVCGCVWPQYDKLYMLHS